MLAIAFSAHRLLAPPPALDRAAFKQKYGGGTAVVTGAARGIGAAFARQIAELGIDLVLVSWRKETLRPTVDAIRKQYGVKVTAVVAKFGDPDAEEAVLRATADLNVSLFVANHAPTNKMYESKCDNVGLKRRYWVNERLEDHLDQASIGYVSILKLTHAYARKQAEAGAGGIILSSSTSSLKPMPFLVQYGSTKAALSHFGLGLWAEMRDFGVDVLTANFGATDTPALRLATTESAIDIIKPQTADAAVSEVLRALGHWPVVVPGMWDKFQEFVARQGRCRRPRRRGSCRTFSASTLTRRQAGELLDSDDC